MRSTKERKNQTKRKECIILFCCCCSTWATKMRLYVLYPKIYSRLIQKKNEDHWWLYLFLSKENQEQIQNQLVCAGKKVVFDYYYFFLKNYVSLPSEVVVVIKKKEESLKHFAVFFKKIRN